MHVSGYLGIDAGTQGLSVIFTDAATRILAQHVRYRGGLEWDWSDLHTMPIPDEFIASGREYLAGPLASTAEHRGWKLPETTLAYPWIRRMFGNFRSGVRTARYRIRFDSMVVIGICGCCAARCRMV